MRRLTVLLLTASVTLSVAPRALADPGDLTLRALPDGCLSSAFIGPVLPDCRAEAYGLKRIQTLAVSADARNLYGQSYGDSTAGGAVTAFARGVSGSITRLSPAQAPSQSCLTRDGTDTDGVLGGNRCVNLRGPGATSDSTQQLAVAPDGRRVYAVGATENLVTVLDRDPGAGVLSQRAGAGGCASADGRDGDGQSGSCAVVSQLDRPYATAVSPDGRFLYTAGGGGIVVFAIGADGGLSFASCVNDTGTAGCADERLLEFAFTLVISPDGKDLYAGSRAAPVGGVRTPGIAAFSRDTATGALTQLAGTTGCVSGTGYSGDPAAPCTDGRVSGQPFDIAMAPNGRSAYLSTDNGLVRLMRDTSTGGVVQPAGAAGCASANGTDGDGGLTCADRRLGSLLYDVTVDPSGRGLTVTSSMLFEPSGVGGLTVFTLDQDGALTERPGTAGCITAGGKDDDGQATCATLPLLQKPLGTAMSPDGTSFYVAAESRILSFDRQPSPLPTCTTQTTATGFQAATAVALPCTEGSEEVTVEIVSPPASGSLGPVDQSGQTVAYTPNPGFSGADGFTFRAVNDEYGGASAPVTATVNVAAASTSAPSAGTEPGTGTGGSMGPGTGTGGGPGTGTGAGTTQQPAAKRSAGLKVRRAAITGSKLVVVASISSSATGRLTGRFVAGGVTTRFTVKIARRVTKIRIRRPLGRKARRARSGKLTLSYAGNAVLRAGNVRVRVARRG